MKPLIGILFLVLNASSVMATDWNCYNRDMEISCIQRKCESSNGFTPMQISFDDKGSMTVCAYTGCWEGIGKVYNDDNYTIIIGHNLKFSTSSTDNMNADFLIAIDTDDNIAVVKGFTYAMPMTCEATEKSTAKSTQQW